MNHRLQQFLAAENLTQAQFADSIDVAKASISHILSGRNKPGFDFIENTAKRYPSLNLEWLITGKGKMYKQDTVLFDQSDDELFPSAKNPAPETTVKAARKETPEPVEDYPYRPVEKPAEQPETTAAPVAPMPLKTTESHAPLAAGLRVNSTRSISRIVVFYDDNTYQELK